MLAIDGFGYSLGAAKNAAVARLQRALTLLGMTVGDPSIAAKDDGLMGPATAAAVNRAFTAHIGSSQAPAAFRTGKLTQAQIKTSATTLSGLIEKEIARRGGSSAVARTAPKPAPAPKPNPFVAAKPAAKAPAKPTKSAAVLRLQTALRALGAKTNDKALLIVADGLIGPKTATATNRAFTAYITSAPPEARTGRLTAPEIAGVADMLAPLVEAEAKKRGAKPIAVPRVAAKLPATTPKGKTVKAPAVANLQRQLVAFGKVVKDAGLAALVVDGLVGPKTTTAVNRAFVIFIPGTTYSTGTLSAAQITASAAALTSLVSQAIVKKGAKPAPIPEPTAEEAAPEPEAVAADEAATAAEEAPAPASAAPAPTYIPAPQLPPPQLPAPPAYTPASAQSPLSPGALTPPSYDEDPAAAAEAPAAAEKKPFPTKWVVGGALAAVGLGATVYFMSRNSASYGPVPQRRSVATRKRRYA